MYSFWYVICLEKSSREIPNDHKNFWRSTCFVSFSFSQVRRDVRSPLYFTGISTTTESMGKGEWEIKWLLERYRYELRNQAHLAFDGCLYEDDTKKKVDTESVTTYIMDLRRVLIYVIRCSYIYPLIASLFLMTF